MFTNLATHVPEIKPGSISRFTVGDIRKDSRNAHPQVVLHPDTYIPGPVRNGLTDMEREQLNAGQTSFTQRLFDELAANGSMTTIAAPELTGSFGEHGNPQPIFVKRVMLGALSTQMENALSISDPREFRDAMRILIPEVQIRSGERPLITESAEYTNKSVIPGLPQNHVNLITILDPDNKIGKLPTSHKVELGRVLMTHFGSFKVILQSVTSGFMGGIKSDRGMLMTLEGGHPTLKPDEIARRLILIASAGEVGGQNIDRSRYIPLDHWRSNPVVTAMQQFCQALGEDFFGSPIEVQNLVNDPALARYIRSLLNWGRQAPGAFWAWDQHTVFPDLPYPFNLGLMAMSATGKVTETPKFNPGFDDIVPSYATLHDSRINVIPLGSPNGIAKNISVEAEEAGLPLASLASAGIVTGGLHGHVTVFIDRRDKELILAPYAGLNRQPQYPCGSAGMLQVSKENMNYAYEQKQKHREAVAIAFLTADHGIWLNFLGDPVYAMERIIRAKERGSLVFNPNVRQI